MRKIHKSWIFHHLLSKTNALRRIQEKHKKGGRKKHRKETETPSPWSLSSPDSNKTKFLVFKTTQRLTLGTLQKQQYKIHHLLNFQFLKIHFSLFMAYASKVHMLKIKSATIHQDLANDKVYTDTSQVFFQYNFEGFTYSSS